MSEKCQIKLHTIKRKFHKWTDFYCICVLANAGTIANLKSLGNVNKNCLFRAKDQVFSGPVHLIITFSKKFYNLRRSLLKTRLFDFLNRSRRPRYSKKIIWWNFVLFAFLKCKKKCLKTLDNGNITIFTNSNWSNKTWNRF